MAAINCIASYGIIDKSSLNQQRILLITNKNVVTEFVEKFEEFKPKGKKCSTHRI